MQQTYPIRFKVGSDYTSQGGSIIGNAHISSKRFFSQNDFYDNLLLECPTINFSGSRAKEIIIRGENSQIKITNGAVIESLKFEGNHGIVYIDGSSKVQKIFNATISTI